MPDLSTVVHALMLLAAGQSLFLGLQLWRLRHRNPFGYGNLILVLAGFLAMLTEQWLVYEDGWRDFPHALRATVWVPFLIGPGLWLFVTSLQQPRARFRDGLHYLPAVLALLYYLPFLLQTGQAKIDYILHTRSIPLQSSVFGTAKIISLVAYTVAIRMRLRHSLLRRDDRLTRRFAATTNVFLGFLLVMAAVFVVEHIWGDLPLPGDALAPIGLGVFIYAVSLIAVAHWRDFALSLVPRDRSMPAHGLSPSLATDVDPSINQPVRATASPREPLLDSGSSAGLYEHVRSQVLQQALYRQPGLKIDDLSEALGLPVHYLSFVINSESGLNFQSWLNQIRVEDAQRALEARGDVSVLETGFGAGFNSKASFNRAFKLATGMTPSAYRAAKRSQITN